MTYQVTGPSSKKYISASTSLSTTPKSNTTTLVPPHHKPRQDPRAAQWPPNSPRPPYGALHSPHTLPLPHKPTKSATPRSADGRIGPTPSRSWWCSRTAARTRSARRRRCPSSAARRTRATTRCGSPASIPCGTWSRTRPVG